MIIEHEYQPKGAALALLDCRDSEVLLDGPANTGKSRAAGESILQVAVEYPGSRQAVVRKCRVDLTESFLVTWENKVIGEGQDSYYLSVPLAEGATRATRRSYEFKNGSVVVPLGMDNPTRLYSTEWDRIYFQEAIEFNEDEWERATRGLRNHVVPWQQLLADTNPAGPQHWLNRRCNRGQTTRLLSRHADNPACTEEDLQRLRNLTGVRRARLYEGKWVASEGQIWENWDEAVHIVDRVPADSIRYHIAGVDWGFRAPGTITVLGVDNDKRACVVKQIYQTERSMDWWVPKAVELNGRYRIQAWACDPAEPGFIQDFKTAGLAAREADNDVARGLDCVRDRLALGADGRPGLTILRHSLESRDQRLDEANLPCSLQEEIPQYVYRELEDGRAIKEEPDPGCADHACDGLRYALMYLDATDKPSKERKPVAVPARLQIQPVGDPGKGQRLGFTLRHEGEDE